MAPPCLTHLPMTTADKKMYTCMLALKMECIVNE